MNTVIYTCVIKGKNDLITMRKEADVRYVCFSDHKFHHPTWEFQPIEPLGQSDPRRIARRYKVLSHLYFPGMQTIWLDGRVTLKQEPSYMFAKYGADFALRLHPIRTCIYQEAEQIKKQKYEDPVIVDRQIKMYRKEGYPELNGLNETGCLLRRPTERVAEFNNYLWSILSAFSKRDQLAFNYCVWKLRLPIMQIERGDVSVGLHKVKTTINT